jgi:hypothetical protein
MDDGPQEPVRKTRLLAWLAAAFLIAGVVSAGAVAGRDGDESRVVSAAGVDAQGVEVPTTVPPTTTTVPAPTTTAAPPTTAVPRPTTTKAPVTTTTPTTAAGVRLTVVNQHPFAVKLLVNGRTFTVAPGQQVGPTAITRAADGNDIVELSLVAEPSCGSGDADTYFPRPGSYRMTIVASQGLCQPGMPGPEVKVTPA